MVGGCASTLAVGIRCANVAGADGTDRVMARGRAAIRSLARGREPRSVAAHDRGLVLVDVDDQRQIAGAVGAYDGRRGWVNCLAFRPDMRGRGIANKLMAEPEERLKAIGCPKINLLIGADNTGVVPLLPGARLPGRRPDLHGEISRHCSPTGTPPELSDEPYVFDTAASPPPQTAKFVAILEDGGPHAGHEQGRRGLAQLEYSYVAARIMLRVTSALEEIGRPRRSAACWPTQESAAT